MNLTGQMLGIYTPAFVRRRALLELFEATASAFGVSVPPSGDASADELLGRYAVFTAQRATAVLHSGEDTAPISQKLYDSAYAIGARLRRDFGVSSTVDAMAAARALYRMLGIEFRPSSEGEIRIPHCYFSGFYSPSVCRLISALDQGLLAGLSEGGRFEFQQRITEGAVCCVATFAVASP